MWGDADENIGAPARVATLREGFTFAELLVCIGIIAVLVGLALPQFELVSRRARMTRHMSQARQDATLINLYAADHDDVYPVASEMAINSVMDWHLPVVELGYASSIHELDPEMEAGAYRSHYALTQCAVFDKRLMRPGFTVPRERQFSSPVRVTEMQFPADKGLVWRRYDLRDFPWVYWCCVDPGTDRPGPVVFADLSSAMFRWTDLVDGNALYRENDIGVPVWTTWLGSQGRDRH